MSLWFQLFHIWQFGGNKAHFKNMCWHILIFSVVILKSHFSSCLFTFIYMLLAPKTRGIIMNIHIDKGTLERLIHSSFTQKMCMCTVHWELYWSWGYKDQQRGQDGLVWRPEHVNEQSEYFGYGNEIVREQGDMGVPERHRLPKSRPVAGRGS